ncbi:hypothetical protein PG997_001082 [Apiospora hydei]|uniref:Uncharacterized protein n=1 Tax=Apiospora hydei TaxID=1337664 RepID=A0ABR1XCU4_9PEZI
MHFRRMQHQGKKLETKADRSDTLTPTPTPKPRDTSRQGNKWARQPASPGFGWPVDKHDIAHRPLSSAALVLSEAEIETSSASGFWPSSCLETLAPWQWGTSWEAVCPSFSPKNSLQGGDTRTNT